MSTPVPTCPSPDSDGPSEAIPLLRIAHLSKSFGGTKALDDVSLNIAEGEIHALVGQNGSGKSTLIKVLAGYHTAEPGLEVEFTGEAFQLGGRDLGDRLRFVHQDLGLVLELSAMDNLALRGSFARGFAGRVRWREQERTARSVLERFEIDFDIHRPLSEATPVERAVIAIAGALQGWHGGRGVLVLDEPTAVLPHEEVERLHRMVRAVQASGTSVLYVSHRLDEIFELADTVTVLRNGELVTTRRVADIDPPHLASLIVGEDVDPHYRADVCVPVKAEPVVEVRNVHGRWLRGIDLTVARGEILGIAGLPGDGLHELPYAIAGRPTHPLLGEIRYGSQSPEWRDIGRAAAVPLVPADRGTEGVIAEFSVGENISLAALHRLRRHGHLDHRAESRLIESWMDTLSVVAASRLAPISTLSGGNQQKAVIARCLTGEPEVLVLCEPTAGVDIGTRIELYDLLARLAARGLTIIVASTDVDDLVAICTRAVILGRGRVAGELDGASLNQHALVSAMTEVTQ